jgi:hypothetical protein
MDKRIIRALKDSIRKWERIVQGTGKDDGTANCPLCVLFFDGDCKGCPVEEWTGLSGCNDSPYSDWNMHQCRHGDYGDFPYSLHCGKCQRLAIKELEFLVSLLPKDKRMCDA